MFKKILKVIFWIIITFIVLLLALALMVSYKISKSEDIATAFCNGVEINHSIDALILKAGEEVLHQKIDDTGPGVSRHAFYIPGFIYSYTSCDVVVSQGRVTEKKVVSHSD